MIIRSKGSFYLARHTIDAPAHGARETLNARLAEGPAFTITSTTVKGISSSALCRSESPRQPALVVLSRHEGADFPFLQHSSTTHSRTGDIWFFTMTHHIGQTIFAEYVYALAQHCSLTGRVLLHTNSTLKVFCIRN